MTRDVQVLVPASLVEHETRNDWRVQLPAALLANRSHHRAEYHRARLSFWLAEQQITRNKIRESGVEFREQQITAGERFEAIMDASLSKRLAECGQKINNHRTGISEYERWEAFLEAMGGAVLTLSREDFHYFQPKPPGVE